MAIYACALGAPMARSFAHTEILLAYAKAQHALTAQRNLYMIRPRAGANDTSQLISWPYAWAEDDVVL